MSDLDLSRLLDWAADDANFCPDCHQPWPACQCAWHLRELAASYRRQAASGYVHAHDRDADLARADELDKLADEEEKP